MTEKEALKIAEIINDIRRSSANAPTQDGRIQSEAAVDLAGYRIADELIKEFELKNKFLVACHLRQTLPTHPGAPLVAS